MKTIKYYIIALLSFSLLIGNVYAAKEKKEVSKTEDKEPKVVNVYMLTKDGCSGCEAAYEYFDKLKEDNSGLFELIPFEVFDKKWNWNSDELQTLFLKVYEYFKEDTSKASTPTIVIGNYHSLGLPNDKTIIYNAIIDAQKSGEDVVEKIANANNLDIEKLKFDRSKKDLKEKDSNKYDAIIIIGIFVFLIGGFASLVVLGKK